MSDDTESLMTGGNMSMQDGTPIETLTAQGVVMQVLQGNEIDPLTAVHAARAANLEPAPMSVDSRVERLEREVVMMREEIYRLKTKLTDFFTIHLGGRLG